jgi:signal transduction histidine kinase
MHTIFKSVFLSFPRFFAAFCMGVAMVSTQVFAGDLVSQRSYWEDVQGQATFADASQQNYQFYDGILAKGYSDSAFWFRLRIEGVTGAHAGEKLVLRVRPAFLDRVTLVDPADAERTTPGEAGDMTTWADVEYPSLNHAFLIPALPQARDVYLRVSSTSTMMVYAEAFTLRETSRLEHAQELMYAIGIGLIVLFWAWVLISWINDREPVNRTFVIKQFASIVYTVGYFGYFRVFFGDALSPSGVNLLFNTIVIGSTGLAFWYERYFLHDYELPNWVFQALKFSNVFSLILLVLLWCGVTRLALQLNMLLIAMGTTMLVFSVVFCIKTPSIKSSNSVPFRFNRWVLSSYYVSLTMALWMGVLPSLGVFVATEFSLHNLVLNGFFSGLLMTILLEVRARRFELSRREISNALYLSQQQVALERQRRDEQSHFLHMLMHELKTPLAVIDMAVRTQTDLEKSSTYVSRAVLDMKAIIDRCVDADQIEEGKLDAKAERVDTARLIHELIFSQNIASERLQLEVEDVSDVLADRQYLRIILGNLLDNAVRYSNAQFPIEIHVASAPGPDGAQGVTVTFSNRPGFAAWPEPSKVFQKYYRSTGAQSQSGTGLGLFLVSSLAKRIGAYCRYAPDDRRVRFVLWLPI